MRKPLVCFAYYCQEPFSVPKTSERAISLTEDGQLTATFYLIGLLGLPLLADSIFPSLFDKLKAFRQAGFALKWYVCLNLIIKRGNAR